MKLLDAAKVQTRPTGEAAGENDKWTRGWEGDSRVCSGIHVYLSECDPGLPESTADVVGDDEFTNGDCGYRVIPFGIIAELDRKTMTGRDDDQDWLRAALKAGAEIPVSRGLLIRQGWGSTQGDTWIGSPNAHEIPAPAAGDSDALAEAVSDGRAEFYRRTLGIDPILHVNPGQAIALKKAGVLELDPVNGDDRTAWGDPVVISQGYYDIPDLSVTPVAFWTGPIEITLSDVMNEEVIRQTRMNRARLQVTMLAAIDTAPCAMVRIGAAPAPVAP